LLSKARLILISSSKYKNPLAFLLFTLLSIIAIGANPLANETVGPFDLLISYEGWSSAAPRNVNVRSYERSDVLDSIVANWIKVKNELYRNINNLNEKKLDLAWDFYGLIWNPSKLLFIIIPNDPSAFYFAMLFKLIIAGFGAYLFLHLFLSFPASVWGGIVYSLCGFQAAWLFWPQVSTSMWIPWLLWTIGSYLKFNKSKYLFILTLVSVFMINGNFPAVAAYGFYSIALFILVYNIFNCKNIRSFFLKTTLPFVFIIFAFFISADYLFSLSAMIQKVDLSHRAYASTGLRLNDLHNFYNPFKDFRVETSVYSGFLAFIFSLVSFSFLLLRKKSKKIISIYMFSLLLMTISILLAYGLIPHNLIRKIPGFSSNPWSRMSVIIGLSMALLSSFVIEILHKLKTKSSIITKLVSALLILFLLFQFTDQKKYFNKFNGPTLSEYFYPVTPSIEFVGQNISDYQSIIADGSFNVSGVLAAYGLFEWYRHSFRTNAEKKLLDSLIPDSSSTPTAFTIPAQNINFSSPLINLFAIKYILIDANKLKHLFLKQEQYRVHRLEPSIAVIENLKCPEGPYLISDINKYPPLIEFANLNYVSSENQIKITLPENSTGYVIIPRPNDNYLAYVDGKLQRIDQYLNVFPAIRVHNNSQVLFEEKPFYFMNGPIISIVSLFIVIITLILLRKKIDFKPNFCR